jgi:hypothetical protein
MNSSNLIVRDAVPLGSKHWDVPMRVDLRAYLQFSLSMEMQLRQLVACWARGVTPRSLVASDRWWIQHSTPRAP